MIIVGYQTCRLQPGSDGGSAFSSKPHFFPVDPAPVSRRDIASCFLQINMLLVGVERAGYIPLQP